MNRVARACQRLEDSGRWGYYAATAVYALVGVAGTAIAFVGIAVWAVVLWVARLADRVGVRLRRRPTHSIRVVSKGHPRCWFCNDAMPAWPGDGLRLCRTCRATRLSFRARQVDRFADGIEH
jgi:hypothetical protein